MSTVRRVHVDDERDVASSAERVVGADAERPLLRRADPGTSAAGDSGAEIVERIRLGDEAAFDDLVRRYYGELCHFIRGDVGAAVASEIVQDLFWNIWRIRGTWHVQSSLAGYLFNAAHHAVLTHRRRLGLHERWERGVTQRGEAPLMGTVGQAADERAEMLELRDAVRHAIDQLPLRCRQVAVLRFLHDYSCPQIGEALGISTKTVEHQAAKAIRVLRRALGPLLER